MAGAFPSHSKRVHPNAEVLRRNLIEQLQRLPDEGVAVLHDLAQELEMRTAWSDFSEGMAADWAAGKYEGLGDALMTARQTLRAARLG